MTIFPLRGPSRSIQSKIMPNFFIVTLLFAGLVKEVHSVCKCDLNCNVVQNDCWYGSPECSQFSNTMVNCVCKAFPSNNKCPYPDIPSPSPPSPSYPSYPSTPSYPSYPSTPSYPSYPSYPSTPSYPSYPSYPSTPSYPSYPSYPSTPSYPSYPSAPSYPSYPSYPSTPSMPSSPSTLPSDAAFTEPTLIACQTGFLKWVAVCVDGETCEDCCSRDRNQCDVYVYSWNTIIGSDVAPECCDESPYTWACVRLGMCKANWSGEWKFTYNI